MNMAFHTTIYDVFVALGDPNARPLWMWEIWQHFLPAIDPLIQAARGRPAVRSSQYLPNRGGAIKFGRLGWKEADHQKWSHASPANQNESRSWDFLNLEVWAPAWTACERENRAPDVYFCIANESLGGGPHQELLFNPVVLLAVWSELAHKNASIVGPVMSALREMMVPKLIGYQQRPWGRAFGPVAFTNSIQDLPMSGLFKPGPRHRGVVGFHLFADEWQRVLTDGVAPEQDDATNCGRS
jgi:hypothetical protein